jgi:hypothetical protein
MALTIHHVLTQIALRQINLIHQLNSVIILRPFFVLSCRSILLDSNIAMFFFLNFQVGLRATGSDDRQPFLTDREQAEVQRSNHKAMPSALCL